MGPNFAKQNLALVITKKSRREKGCVALLVGRETSLCGMVSSGDMGLLSKLFSRVKKTEEMPTPVEVCEVVVDQVEKSEKEPSDETDS